MTALVLALHRSKRAKFADDAEMQTLYRRIVDERPDLVLDYARRMTGLARRILADGVARSELWPCGLKPPAMRGTRAGPSPDRRYPDASPRSAAISAMIQATKASICGRARSSRR